jgi:hypothetical protein
MDGMAIIISRNAQVNLNEEPSIGHFMDNATVHVHKHFDVGEQSGFVRLWGLHVETKARSTMDESTKHGNKGHIDCASRSEPSVPGSCRINSSQNTAFGSFSFTFLQSWHPQTTNTSCKTHGSRAR